MNRGLRFGGRILPRAQRGPWPAGGPRPKPSPIPRRSVTFAATAAGSATLSPAICVPSRRKR